MALERINKLVVSYCEIPEGLTEDHWISEYMNGCFVEVHVDNGEEDEDLDPLGQWIRETYPELEKENSFLIEMDY